MIDGVFVPTLKNDAATNNKPDDTYKEDFRALLKEEDKPSSNKSIRATHLNSTSAQATTPNINPVEASSDHSIQVYNTSTNATDANAALLGLNLVTPQSSTPTLGLKQPAAPQNTQTAIAPNQLSSQLNVIGNEAAQTDAQSANNGAKTGIQTNAATLNETGAKLASIIKGSETGVSQADLAQLAPNNAKQAATTLTSSANTTNTSTPATTLTSAQSGAQAASAQPAAQAIQSQPVAQGASAQFLQAAKTGNSTGAAIGKTSSTGSNGITATTSTAATSASSPSAAPAAANVTPVVGAQAAVPNNVLPTLNTAAQDVLAALPDSDTIDGMELGTKDSSTQSTTSSAATTKTPDLPPGLRNASPVTQQAWAGLISRMDGKSHQFQIRLDPAELGRINVSIEITKDKKATVVLAARSAEALAELSKGARSLEAALADAGVELEEGGLKLEMSSDESSSFTFSDDDETETKNNGDGQTNAPASQEADNDDIPRQITPEITAWSRKRVNLTA